MNFDSSFGFEIKFKLDCPTRRNIKNVGINHNEKNRSIWQKITGRMPKRIEERKSKTNRITERFQNPR